jgi:hypothetical protein
MLNHGMTFCRFALVGLCAHWKRTAVVKYANLFATGRVNIMLFQKKVATALISLGLGGCALNVPEIGEFWDPAYPGDPEKNTPVFTSTAQIEYEIKQKLYCELKHAVQEAEKLDTPNSKPLIPHGWGVQMQLSLGVDESISLNPGIAFTQLLPNAMRIFGVFPTLTGGTSLNSVVAAQSFTLGLGGVLSREAIRTDKFNTYYSIKELALQKSYICLDNGRPDASGDPFINRNWKPAVSSPLLIDSDLGIKDWLIGAMYYDFALPSSVQPLPAPPGGSNAATKFEGTFEGNFEGPIGGKAKGKFTGQSSSGGSKPPSGGSKPPGGGSPSADPKEPSTDSQDSFSIEIKFIIVSSGNVQPTWKLIRFSANTGSPPLFGTGRTRTHDLIITIGPPTQRTQNDFLASQIGEAVRSGNSAAQ